ncbi:MAG TPA: SDR family oxidoreductase [Devosia sp.]|jgi:NAD(P)-dependent dehydrogenase (short-subunit alcohol dehydrogenase family)|nr:SDR family oxidoreductase [Devosia sp.]
MGRQQQVVVITGASSGNGRATAHAFARRGARLVLAARRKAELEETVRECAALGGEAIAVVTDTGDAAAVAALAETTLHRFGRIDIWVNCAAVLQFGRVEDTPAAVIEKVIRTNLLGYFYGTQEAIRQFRAQGRGNLINVSSVLGITAQPFAAAYVASKFGIRGLSDSVRLEVSKEPHIHVCTVLPFAIDTPVYQRAANYLGRKMQPVYPRYRPETVADAVLSAVDHPRREVYAGKIGGLVRMAKALAPGLSEQFTGAAVRLLEVRDEPERTSAGNVFEPISDEWKVDGGWKAQNNQSTPSAAPLLVLGAVAGLVAVSALTFRKPRGPKRS